MEAQGGQDRELYVHHQHMGEIPLGVQECLFPNNDVYEVKHKFIELKQIGSISAYVEFTTLTLQIPYTTDKDMMFCFSEDCVIGPRCS